MKRMYKLFLLFILAAAIPLTAAIGQEKKNEQKIKIVINDGSGEKTVLDTTFTGGKMPEKIELKDGHVIFLGEKHVMAYTTSKSTGGKAGGTIVVKSAGTKEGVWVTDEDNGEKVIIIKDGKVIENSGGKVFTVKVGDDEYITDKDVTKYVIAKDGLVVTVEGDDEEKAQALIKEIESKLGVKEEGNVKKEVVKEETKKSVKK